MNILHVVQAMSKKFGGPQAVLHDLIKYQRESGLKIEVVTTNIDLPNGVLNVPTSHSVLVNGVPVHFFPVQIRPILFSFQLRSYFKNSIIKYDLVHIHGLYRFPVTYGALIARNAGIPYIISFHPENVIC